MGVMGDTEGWTGDRLVGEVTVREDKLREREDLLSTIAESLRLDWEDGWEDGWV